MLQAVVRRILCAAPQPELAIDQDRPSVRCTFRTKVEMNSKVLSTTNNAKNLPTYIHYNTPKMK